MIRVAVLALCMTYVAHTAPAQTTRPAVTKPADVRGINWSDPRDNYNPGPIVPMHLKLGDPPARGAEEAEKAAQRVLAVGGNTVRLGINPPTVADAAWWPTYRQAIRTLAGRGVCVILCAWEQSPTVQGHGRGGHNGRFGSGTVASYAAMWKTVHADFVNVPNVIGYELINEPFGYRRHEAEYQRDMTVLIDAIGPDLRGKHVLVAGLGYSDDVKTVAKLFPDEKVWLAYHVYANWFGGEAGENVFTAGQYADEIVDKIKGVEGRTLITEFGCWAGPEYDYTKPSTEQKGSGAARHVAYLNGVADACRRLNLGSVYWFGDARDTRGRMGYDLFATDGKPLDEAKMTVVRRAWGLAAGR